MPPVVSRSYRPLPPERLSRLEAYRLAPFRARAGALLVDSLILLAVIGLLEVPSQLFPTIKTEQFTFSMELGGLSTVVATVLYFGLTNLHWHGRTIGKRLFHIRVIGVAQDNLSMSCSIQRALAYSVSIAAVGLGFLQYFRHPNRQTLHDRIAETIVIVDTESTASDATT